MDKLKYFYRLYDLQGNKISEFRSILEANKSTGINGSHILKMCRTEVKKPKKIMYKFKFKDNE